MAEFIFQNIAFNVSSICRWCLYTVQKVLHASDIVRWGNYGTVKMMG